MKLKRLLCTMLTVTLIISCAGCQNQASGNKTSGVDPSQSIGAPTDKETDVFGAVGGEHSAETNTAAPENTEEESTTVPENETPEATEGSTEERHDYTFEPRNDTVYTTADLNIRREPYNDAEIVTVAPKGTKLSRVGYQEYWCQIVYNGETLYASTYYLTEETPAEPETESSSTTSNDSLPFGYVREQRDSLNVPLAMYSYQDRWGAYADFIQDTSKKIVYLTMDEGYEYGFTPAILDTLKEKNVKAVFFLTGQFVDECPDLVQRMIDEGHIIGNHSTSHPADGMPSLSVDAQKADIMNLHNKVLNQFGYDMKLFRFPAGIYSAQSLEVLSSLGYRGVFWSFAYRDFLVNAQPDLTEAMNMCMNELHPGAIYLLHAVSATNTAILGDWIDAVRAQGYEFGVYPVE